jgi:hypothetical protein
LLRVSFFIAAGSSLRFCVNSRRLTIYLLLAALLSMGVPLPTSGGGADIVIGHGEKLDSSAVKPLNDNKRDASLTPSISGTARPAAQSRRDAQQQSWLVVMRDLLRYLFGDSLPFLNGRLR